MAEWDFDDFTHAVNGHSAYRWQRRLLDHILRNGRWPEGISAPTGSGKSAVIDVHVFAVALHATGRASARPPRRLVLVAPRRVLVDDQHERAKRLANALADPSSGGIVADVAAALRTVVTADDVPEPLLVTRLRGGVALENTWRLDPARCQVICSTPQMWGSRLLLRGYRSSRRARPLESGLAAFDAAVVIDEAHLHRQLVRTAQRVADREPGAGRPQIVPMSATQAVPGAITLTADDDADAGLRARIDAPKAVRVEAASDWPRSVGRELPELARLVAGQGTVGVFVNTVAMALDVAGELAKDSCVEVVCGRMRPADIQRLRTQRRGLLDSRGNDHVEFLVTTQSLEVGVDLDLRAMVTMLAPASALAQRVGRLNRGGRAEPEPFIVLRPADFDALKPAAALPYSVEEMQDAVGWLERLGDDASPRRVAATELCEGPASLAPAITSVDIETFAMTTEPLHAEPDVSLYVDEPRDRREVQIELAARDHLDLDPETVAAMLTAAPPRAHELVALPFEGSATDALRAILDQRPPGFPRDRPNAWVLRRDGRDRLEATILGDVDGLDAESTVAVVIATGAMVCTRGIIGVRRGRPSHEGAIADVMGDRPSEEGAADEILVVDAEDAQTLNASEETLDSRAGRDIIVDLAGRAGASPDITVRLRGRLSDTEVIWCPPGDTDGRGALVVRDRCNAGALPRSAVASRPVFLDDHQQVVAERMERFLAALRDLDLGIDGTQLRQAAELHDEGKRHPRFQARMGASLLEETLIDESAAADARPSPPILAKPLPGHDPDRGDGWRHEQLSAVFAALETGDPLITTLVARHHGCGSPFFDRDAERLLDGWDAAPVAVRAEAERLFGPYGEYELERDVQRQRIGTLGLAHLEALLRCADIQVSREESTR